MKKVLLLLLFLLCSYASYADNTIWKNECVGYYQLQLPDNLEVGVYPAERINTKDIKINSIIGTYHQYHGNNIYGPYSIFYYGRYRVLISNDNVGDFDKYINEVKNKLSYFDYKYYFKKYRQDVFYVSYEKSYSLYIYKEHRLYQFMKAHDDITLPITKEYLNADSGRLSFLSHFQARDLYEIPPGRGFCLPYGFIANDSGNEERDMAVTYRMKNHPDVMIVFQDASYQSPDMIPLDSDLNPIKRYDAKDYAKWLWNHIYMLYPEQKRKLLSPSWFSVTMDGRKGSGSFLEVTRKDGNKDYGYLAFVRADPQNSTKEPDLQVFVTSRSDLTEGHPQISPDELKALAEHIVSSVKHR
ncbi:T6SS immunity protein Tli4 family protein [Escherichia albertii]|uniref:T6SS immunity protein Tli4 family protein n=1 Tax=Escherichia albertii TaxID=208962 RepID=UPI000AC586CF|nr:T6SS immunity protein Tli4 family protein [Escherichia albertii]MCZ8671004.1 T6SS immunity protein Tli4 family protein [Escherichia albertii]WDB43440.1 T6SS immunity protein Tli4 family protein [Escherichia albertii]